MGRDWRWLTRYSPRTASGREQILRALADDGSLLVVALFLLMGRPLWAAVDAWGWWPWGLAINLVGLVAFLAASAAVERAARRSLRRRGLWPV